MKKYDIFKEWLGKIFKRHKHCKECGKLIMEGEYCEECMK